MGDKNVFLYIDGAYMNSQVMLNTECIGKNPYSYTPFYVELTPWLLERNHLEIGTRGCQPNSRWYTGGLYRQAEIWLGNSLFIHPWSVRVQTKEVEGIETDAAEHGPKARRARLQITFGVRMLEFDAKRGMRLNG